MSESEALELAVKYYKENAVTKENLKAFPDAVHIIAERLNSKVMKTKFQIMKLNEMNRNQTEYYIAARGNGKGLLSLEWLLRKCIRDSKPISESIYKYKDAIHKDVKYNLTESEWDKVVVKVQSEWCKNDALVDYLAGNSSFEKAIKEYQDRLYREVSHEAYKVALETGLPYNEAFDMIVKEISERMYKNESKK